MSLDKGSVSVWIWMIGGLIIAILTFTATYYNLTQVSDQAVRQNIVGTYNSLNEDIRLLCGQGSGARTSEEVELREVRAIYASDTRAEPGPYTPVNVSKGNISTGTNFCLTFTDSHYGCQSHDCRISIPFIGTPTPGSDMYVLGAGDGTFEFDLTLQKNTSGWIEIDAEHVP